MALFATLSSAGMVARTGPHHPQAPLSQQEPGLTSHATSASHTDDFARVAEQAAQAHRLGDSKKAVELYRRALRQRPEWSQGWRSLGMLLAGQAEYAAAVEAFGKLLAIEPKDANGWALLGLSQYEMGQYDAAYANIQHARTLGIPNPDLQNVATFHAALIALLQGDFETAHYLLVKVVRSGGDDPDLPVAFGLAALRVASVPAKLQELPDVRLRNLLARAGEIEYRAVHAPAHDTEAAYEKLLQETPNAPGVHYAYGNFLISATQYNAGIAQMRQELALNPKDATAMLQIAMADFRIAQFEEAAAYAGKAARLAPNLFASHYALGWAQFKLGHIGLAIPELETAAAMAPDCPQCRYALSQAYARAGRKSESDRELKAFMRLKATQAQGAQAAVESELDRPKVEQAPSHPAPR